MSGWRIDRELADGASPASSAAHSARAEWLISERRRDELAYTLERLVRESQLPHRIQTAAVPIDREAVRACAPQLLGLAVEMRASAAPQPGGVAALRLLLVDGSGPLHQGGADELWHAILLIREAAHGRPVAAS